MKALRNKLIFFFRNQEAQLNVNFIIANFTFVKYSPMISSPGQNFHAK